MSTDGPSVRRRRLGAELRRWREAAGMTQDQVAAHFEWHNTKVTRMETGRVGVTARDVKDLLALYGVDVDEDYRDALMTLARQTRGHNRAWWNTYKDLLTASYVGLEDEATSIRTWELAVVPGLLQTEDYARLVVANWEDMRRRPRDVERIVSFRMARQQRLAGDDPPELSVVIDESVLRRTLGRPDVVRPQLRQVAELSERDHITVQVLPFTADAAMRFLAGPTTILGFADQALDAVYIENAAAEFDHEDDPAVVERYKLAFQRLCGLALSPAESRRLIAEAADGMGAEKEA